MLLPTDDWNLDIDLRYLPAVRFLQRTIPDPKILEVGSNSIGITPYVSSTVIGTDTVFSGDISRGLLPVVSKGPLPFRDRSFDAVVSMDTLEHVPREFRQGIFEEMFRVARRYVIIGFPEGDAAEEHDHNMERWYVGKYGIAHPYFVEHRTYKLPRENEVQKYLESAARSTKRTYRVQRSRNVNIGLRSFFIKLIWHPKRFVRFWYFVLTMFSRWDGLFTFGTCYRAIYFVSFDQSINEQ